jgi:phosphoglycerate dehydrogenase-like enzyme
LKTKFKSGNASLDVFWNEPSIDPGFVKLDNLVLQPHRSGATVETRTAMAGLVRDNLQTFFNGESLLTEYAQIHLNKLERAHALSHAVVALITNLRQHAYEPIQPHQYAQRR